MLDVMLRKLHVISKLPLQAASTQLSCRTAAVLHVLPWTWPKAVLLTLYRQKLV